MKNKQKISLTQLVVFGSCILAAMLFLGTIWIGHAANRDMDSAVHTVSLLYLDELSERREQVVSSKLQSYINDMDVAVGLLDKSDLESVKALQAYQARMKQLYHLEKFAFINTDGLIYTSRGTRTDILQYDLDFRNFSNPEIFVKNSENSSKKIIVAVPMDRLPFEGKHLVVCFMELDMSRFMQEISLQATGNNFTFCNLYTSEGDTLTDTVLGGLSSDKNLLKALEKASFAAGHSLDAVSTNFSEQRAGKVSFTYNEIRETMSYVPVHGTDWMLTYLVRESVISDQISSISHGMVVRSVVQSVCTVLALAIFFCAMIYQIRKTSRMALDREISETENRVKQEELKEQLALQAQLLEQEKKRVQQDAMITALAADYRSVYYVNLDDDTGICYRNDATETDTKDVGESFPFLATFSEYAHRFVAKGFVEGFLAFLRPDAIRDGLKKDSVIAYRYLAVHNGLERYEMLRIAGVGSSGEEQATIRAIGLGFSDIDAEMRDSMQKSLALHDALKAAEEASKAKTIFLSNMSHEIRTPMNAIIGLDNLALNDPDISDKTREYLNKIGSSAEHLLSLINDILDMSRIESGRMTLRNEEFSFSNFIEQINTIFSGMCQEKKLSYTCRIKGTVDDAYIGDVVKLRQVMTNILGNAVKFTPEGGAITFLVEKTADFDGKSTLCFVIKDTGVGMSKEFLPKLFETFSQEDTSANNRYGSSGLGMAITKNIVDMMSGQIHVESEKGVGTSFTVVVTLLDVEAKAEEKSAGATITPSEMRVLVVDDDPVACDHAQLVLEKAGISSEIALSGQEALEKVQMNFARRSAYNLIIVDWKMPGMDGVEVTRKIRTIIGNETAIIILTAYNWEDIETEARAAGVDSFITKPLFSKNLLHQFAQALQKKIIVTTETKKKADLNGRRILLAEDMVINAEIMLELLQMRGIQPEHAENGKIAVEMFTSHPAGYYDAILMDMRMPEMNGLEATSAIRASDHADAKTIPIIALTANAFDEDVQRSLQAGLNAHLSKPVNPDVLFETLENIL